MEKVAHAALRCEIFPVPRHMRKVTVESGDAASARENHTVNPTGERRAIWRHGSAGDPRGWHTSMAKKLRYMSKIAAIFVRADNTRLNCNQPIRNLPTACL
jgi:hypothetical protein